MTGGKNPESPHLDDLLGHLDRQVKPYFIFEGGYWNIQELNKIKESGNHFVTKRGGSIKPRIIQELPLPEKPLQSGSEVLQDAKDASRRPNPDNEFRVRRTEGREIPFSPARFACRIGIVGTSKPFSATSNSSFGCIFSPMILRESFARY